MDQQATDTTGRRVATAFFDSRDAAEAAQRDLVAAGFRPEAISLAGDGTSVAATPDDDAPILPEQGGFWHALREFFLPEEDRYTYAEGLRRGGIVLSVTTAPTDYERAIDILDSDGAVDIDERERGWLAEGWSGWQEGIDPTAGTMRPDNSTAGFGASFAGEDGYQMPEPRTAPLVDEAETRRDPALVGTDAANSGLLNPDMRERIGAGTASMTPPTPTGSQGAVLHDNAAERRRAAIEDASLGSPTRSGAEIPFAATTIGSTNEDQEDGADPWTARRDGEMRRARVRGFIVDPGNNG